MTYICEIPVGLRSIKIKFKHYLSPEDLYPMLEVAGSQEDILAEQLVLFVIHILVQVLLPGKANFPAALHNLHSDMLMPFFVHIVE